MDTYDITFVGHMCYDEIIPYNSPARIAPGSAVLCGAVVAAKTGKKVAAVVKMAKQDESILEPMKQAGVETFLIPSEHTTYSRVIHPVEDVDVRKLVIVRNAGYFFIDEIPELNTGFVHLAGISDQEFTLDFIYGLKRKGYKLSADMQSFVRQVDPETGEIEFKDVLQKMEIIKELSMVKLDIVEAKVLTNTDDIEKAAGAIEAWGCPEIVITHSGGVLARVNGNTYYEKFSNSSVVGRTGRGDTTFAAYLSWRMDHDPREALKFAAALVSIKMESPGPFAGTVNDVLVRINEKHR